MPVPEPEKDFYAQHARRSRAARAWANMTTEELAEKLGKDDRKYVERRENGQFPYSPGDLLRIAEVTGAPAKFMTDGEGWTAYRPSVTELAAKATRKLAAARARKQRPKSTARSKGAGDSERHRNPRA